MSTLGTVLSVLMVGHSLFGSTGPTMLERALEAGIGDAVVQSQIINGAPLRYNWEHSATAEGVDARDVLPAGGVTHLILTEAIPLDNHVKWSDTGVYAQAFAGLATAANPGVHLYVQETWHSLKSGTGAEIEYDEMAHIPWRDRLDRDLPVWEKIVADIKAGKNADTATVTLIPAGQAMARLYDAIATGEVTQITGIEALFADDIHLNDVGHYFVSMVQYGIITGRSPLGLPAQFQDRFSVPFDAPDTALAGVLQQVAWDTVQAYGGAAIPPWALIDQPVRKTAAPQATTGPPDQPETATAQKISAGTNAVAIGLAAVTDWSTQAPFLDLMKTSRPWIGHRAGQWGGMEYEDLRAAGALDPQGWPIAIPPELGSIGTLILTDMPEAAVSLRGRYVLRFEGKGVIEVAGRAQNVRYGAGEVSFDYTPGPGSVDIRVQRITAADPPRNITVVHENHLRAFDQGAVFNPQWLAHLAPYNALRFMDWTETNNSHLATWDARPMLTDVSYAPGVPIEVLIDLANTLEADAWFNVPHLADDAFVRQYAQMVRDQLHPDLTAYVEFSNEVWNWQFTQARWADTQAQARWGQNDKWMQYYGLRAAEVARIWSDVFAGQPEARLVNLISTQTGWLGLESEALSAPLLVAEGGTAPQEAFDAYAVSGYFGGVLGLEDRAPMVRDWLRRSADQAATDAQNAGLTGQDAEAYVAEHLYRAASALAGQELTDGSVSGNAADTLSDLLGRVWPYHAQIAQDAGLDLIMYEGGSHVVGLGPMVDDTEITAFLQHFNYTAEMGALYARLLEGWQAVGGQLFNAYSDVYAPTKWGSWGALRHLDDANPRWDALVAFQ